MLEDKDYIMRIVHEWIRTLIKLIFNKDIDKDDKEPVSLEVIEQYKKLLSMIDDGEINEAENILLGDFPQETPGYGIMIADFYQHLDEYEDDFLEDHGYSREEILEGLEGLAQEYGLTELE